MTTEQDHMTPEALRKKAKEIEELYKQNEFNKQRNFLINKVRNFLGIEVSDQEVCAVLYTRNLIEYMYYFKDEDFNMLLERKVLNRHAKYHEIRIEDSRDIINSFLRDIKVINNPYVNNCRKSQKSDNINFTPLFC